MRNESGPVVEFASFNCDETYNNIDLDETLSDKILTRGRNKRRGRWRGRGIGRCRGRGRVQKKGKEPAIQEVIFLAHEIILGTETEILVKTTTSSNLIPTRTYIVSTLETQLTQHVQFNKHLEKPFQPKKISKTTTIRKGIVLTVTHSTIVKNGGKRGRPSAASLGGNEDDFAGLDMDDDDDVYIPTDNESGESSDRTVSLDDEDEVESNADYDFTVNDNYGPYEGQHWDEVNDEEYDCFVRLNRNDEMHTHEDFGKIVLIPLQIFISKQHLGVVVID